MQTDLRDQLLAEDVAQLATLRTPLGRLELLDTIAREVAGMMREAVHQAREDGETWQAIGACMSVSKQAVQKRFG